MGAADMGASDMGALGLDPKLLEIIVCPQCHGDLAADETGPRAPALVCQGECGLAYPVRDGIPVLLVDEAEATR